MQVERCRTGQTVFSRPSLHVGAGSCRAAVACCSIARNKVRWRAAEAPESGHFETGPTRRAVCRHDLSCKLGAGVQPTVPKRLLPSLKSRTSVLIRHGIAQRSRTLVKE